MNKQHKVNKLKHAQESLEKYKSADVPVYDVREDRKATNEAIAKYNHSNNHSKFIPLNSKYQLNTIL